MEAASHPGSSVPRPVTAGAGSQRRREAAENTAEEPQLERARINFSWILKLRWAAVAGQLATIMAVEWGLGIDLALSPLFAILAIEAVSNAALELWFRTSLRRGSWAAVFERAENLLVGVMAGDIVLLTVLLYFTGGPTNPFAVFYLVNTVLAAVVLPQLGAWGVTLCALAGYLFLFFLHEPLPEISAWLHADASIDQATRAEALRLYFKGLLVAFGAAGIFMVLFVTRVTSDLAMREEELNEAHKRKAHGSRIEALGTLAAGAAHELSSPLSTIAVVAKELELMLQRQSAEPTAIEDARLIRDEVARCREILDSMASDVGGNRVEELSKVKLPEILESASEGLKRAPDILLRIDASLQERTFFMPRRSVSIALRGVIQNALDASPPNAKVEVSAGVESTSLEVRVLDRGPGMPPDVLERAADPFFTTKEPGEGMGLGLYLSRTVIERLGGTLEFDSMPGRGTRATVSLPLDRLSPPSGGRDT